MACSRARAYKRTGHRTRGHSKACIMAKVLRPSIQKQTRPQSLEKLPMAGISAPSDSRTGRIVKCTVRVLLENEGYRNDHGLSLINPVGQPKEEELLLADRVVDLILRLVNDPRQSGKRITVAQLEESDWHIEADNIHTEFNIVANQIFSEDINWGRVVSFLSFSSTFVLYAMRRGMSDSIIQSVCGWTVVFMESRLRDWFQTHSWVSNNNNIACQQLLLFN